MTSTQEFCRSYVRTMAMASIAFAFAHGFQIIIGGLISQHSFNINSTAFIVLISYVTLEAMVFFLVGCVAAYFPSRAGNQLSLRMYGKYRIYYVLFGLALGVIFLPLCAGVAFFVSPFPDEPSYLARCAEFGLPMTIAGVVGGYVFWRCARGPAGNGELAADQFS